MEDASRLQLADDVTFQSMGASEQTVILSLTTGQLFTCNDTTAAMMAAMDGERTFGEIVDVVLAAFEVSREKLHADLETMARQLVDEGLVRIAQ